MGYKRIQLFMPTDYREEELVKQLRKQTGLPDFTWFIEKKSLDARKKGAITWHLTLLVMSEQLPGEACPETSGAPALSIPRRRREQRAVVVGTGPAGIFAALVLCRGGFRVDILERGSRIEHRRRALDAFESGGPFPASDNYAFGEGGAGAFSDGKLTSRSKQIRPERAFIHQVYIAAGAPREISWLAHPHIGSDKLYTITANLRKEVESSGGTFHFNSTCTGFSRTSGGRYRIEAGGGGDGLEADLLFLACGHSADDTLKMAMAAGIPYRTKNFALGFRVEHPQALINRAQWGVEALAGVKAAEYRLTAPGNIYTFCMCPGGRVIPAAAFEDRNTVNGMSLYLRDGAFANAAVVAALHPDELAGAEGAKGEEGLSPEGALEMVADLEGQFYDFSRRHGSGYGAPASSIEAFLAGRGPGILPGKSSYPFPLIPADPKELYPAFLLERLEGGLQNFCRKLKGYNSGILLGLESRTSSSVQVLRENDWSACGFPGIFVVGEASGWAGGIISSAADGIRAALSCCQAAVRRKGLPPGCFPPSF
jgi:uncharacterized protein